MSVPSKAERSLLSHEDHEIVAKTHHPSIYELSRDELHDLRKRLRDLRDRERTLVRQKIREIRGKVEERGGSFPGTAEHPAKRKQVFANALKRLNREFSRIRKIDARQALTDAAQRALAFRKAGEEILNRPANTPTASKGAKAKPSKRSRSHVPGSQVGSVSQATKKAQAAKDKRAAAKA